MAKIFVNQRSTNQGLLQSWIGEHGESFENMENMENMENRENMENMEKHGKDGKHQPVELQGEQVQLCLMISL